jgi:Mannosyltransferase (PIG-V)
MNSQAEGRAALPIVVQALLFRVFSALLAFLANVSLPAYRPDQFKPMFAAPNPFWDGFVAHDSGWYYQIARDGYQFVAGGAPVGLGKAGKIAFFPVYPLLMRYAGRLFGLRPAAPYLGGIVVSWAAFAIAMVVLYFLARLDVAADRARRAVVLAAIFPFAFFFGVVYTESVFLLLTVTTFYAFRTRRWLLGGISGALATATRVNGILMLPALAWIAWRAAGSDTRDRTRAAAALAATTAGLAAYSLYVYGLTGNPLEWAASIERWNYFPGGAPWLGLWRLLEALFTRPYTYFATERLAPFDTLNGLAAILFVAAIPLVWKRLGAAYALFIAANLWLPLSSGQYEGLGRYCAVLFPFFIWLAQVRSESAFRVAVLVSAMLYPICLTLFTKGLPLF